MINIKYIRINGVFCTLYVYTGIKYAEQKWLCREKKASMILILMPIGKIHNELH